MKLLIKNFLSYKDYINKLEMVQRQVSIYVTNQYRNTRSVTSMLEHLEWETLETRRAKYHLTMMFKIIHGVVDIPADDHLTAASTRTRAHHSHKFRHIPASTDYYKTASFRRLFTFGIPSWPPWPRLPFWYVSNGSSPV